MTALGMLWDCLLALAPPVEALGVVALSWIILVVAVCSGYDPAYDGTDDDNAEDD